LEPKQQKFYRISEQTLQAIVDFLSEQKFKSVAAIMSTILQEVEAQRIEAREVYEERQESE